MLSLAFALHSESDGMATFDAASWHDEIPTNQAVTHIGMFVGWAITRDLIAGHYRVDPSSSWYIARILERERTAADFVVDFCRGRLTETDFSNEGCAFARLYYARYLQDYARVFEEYMSVYEVPDTWDNFDRMALILDRRLVQFRKWCAKQTDIHILYSAASEALEPATIQAALADLTPDPGTPLPAL